MLSSCREHLTHFKCPAFVEFGLSTKGEWLATYVLTEPEASYYAGSIGKPIAEQQGIQFTIAEMATELQAARLLVN